MSEDMSTDTLIELKEGDVYRFSYSQKSWDKAKDGLGHGDMYWCFDGQLIYRDGLLCDTYWGMDWGGDNGRYFTLADAQAKGTLAFVCNLNDVEKIHAGDYELYADGDAFNLSNQHGCHRYYVKRKGARKDKQRMRDAVERTITAASDELERAQRNLTYLMERRDGLLERIEAGDEPYI